jgi:hypothetical protein
VIRNLEFRTGINLNNDHEITGEILVTRPLGDISVGPAEGANLLFGNSELEETVKSLTYSMVQYLAFADPLINQGGGHLALTEAWDVNLLGDVLVGVVEAWLELLRGDRDSQANAGGAKRFLCRCGHGIFSN